MTTTGFGDRVLDALGEAFNERAGALLPDLVDALTAPVGQTDAQLQPGPRGWAPIYDLDGTLDPAWLGQVIGTRVPDGLSLADQRAYIRDRSAFRRGTPGAISAAVAAVLTGAKHVYLVERDGSPWRLTVNVYTAELPSGGIPAVRAAVETQRPVGIVLSVVENSGASYAHMLAQHGPTYAAQSTAFATYNAATMHLPEGGTTP